jgi:(E)-4-hydroxy-3-methylbut-2-enyl-diphosphate synthase
MKNNPYRTPRRFSIGGFDGIRRVEIGGDAPVTLQTMWKEGIARATETPAALDRLLGDINALAEIGCDILRFAVPDMRSAAALAEIAGHTSMPLVADIHYDHRFALACLKGPVAKVRLNPGNMASREGLEAVVARCREKGVAIRIGVNSGSLPPDLAEQVNAGKLGRAPALVEAALREAAILEELHFSPVVVSIKASNAAETVEAARLFARQSDIPLHLGVTEAGPLIGGLVKSTVALGALLTDNIGSTIRVSLSSSPENEVLAGRAILAEYGKRQGGVTLVSCPRCGRVGFDVQDFVERWQHRLYALPSPITVAVMGCPVNGPGEARHADIGITGSGTEAILFRRGSVVRRVPAAEADGAFEEELHRAMTKQGDGELPPG